MVRRAVTFVDALACVLLFSLGAAFCLAVQTGVDDVETRVRCAANLRQIGQAITTYAKENRGAFPRTAYEAGPKPVPVWGTPYEGDADLGPLEGADPFAKDDSPGAKTRPRPNDVTAPLFLLMRTQEITSPAFVCPATFNQKFEFGGGTHHALHWTNWPGNKGLRAHLGYSYQNPYPSNDAVAQGFRFNSSLNAEFVVAADMNPGAAALTKTGLNAEPRAHATVNSLNHRGDGQNFLFGDGHVEFDRTPFSGVKRDNVYTYGPSGSDHPDKGGEGVVGSPTSANDTILLPTARDVGATDEQGNLIETNPLKPLSAAEQADLRKKIVGTYARQERRNTFKLEVTADKFVASQGPATVTFAYAIGGAADGFVHVRLTAPSTDPHTAAVKVEPDGSLTVRGNPFLRGEWKRQP